MYRGIRLFLVILRACSITGSLDKAREIHDDIVKAGFHMVQSINNSLIDAYVKCGSIFDANYVFDKLTVRCIVSWTAMMAGFAHLGEAKVVLGLFEMVKAEGIAPDLVMFLILLSACNHAGLLEEGEKWFDEMSKVYW